MTVIYDEKESRSSLGPTFRVRCMYYGRAARNRQLVSHGRTCLELVHKKLRISTEYSISGREKCR